jgi:transcription termination factor Rho
LVKGSGLIVLLQSGQNHRSQRIANSISKNCSDVHLMVVLIERPKK